MLKMYGEKYVEASDLLSNLYREELWKISKIVPKMSSFNWVYSVEE